MPRRMINDGWRFHLGDAQNAQHADFDDSAWRLLDLPHDWSIELPRSPDNRGFDQGGFFEDGVAWYRKRLAIPADARGKRLGLLFEGVYKEAEVFVNDHALGLHAYGYTSFGYDITPHVGPDEDEIVVAVRVENSSHRHTRWYSGSGIYRHVWLEVNEPVHVARWGVYVTTPEVGADAAAVHVRTRVENHETSDRNVTATWRIVSPDGTEVATTSSESAVPAGGQGVLEGSGAVPSPALWGPETPRLYTLETRIDSNGETCDTRATAFGVRSFHFSAEEGFVLNGERVLLRGGCVHHDCGPLGSTSVDRAEERKVEVLKDSGFNAIRCAHNPPSPAFLDACDRLGMLVIDEAFDVWRAGKCPYDYHRRFDDWWQRDLDSMLLRDRNHPSIVLWSIGNELVERQQPEGAEIARMLADRVRATDPTRPITAGINGGPKEWPSADDLFATLDVCGYNYQPAQYEGDHARLPARVIIATESFPKDAFEYWNAVQTHSWVAGDFVWTSHDYLGEAGIGYTRLDDEPGGFLPGWPWHQANCGDIDLCGWKRPQSYYRDVVWGRAAAPYIAVHPPVPEGRSVVVSGWGWPDVQSSWTHPAWDGSTVKVDVYFDCNEVELILNGQSLGRRPATAEEKYIASFEVAYAPGTLKAVAYRGGAAVAESTLTTAGAPRRVALSADRNPVRAAATDLAYVTARVLDAGGGLVPCANDVLYFSIRGPGRIAALASVDPRNTEPYRGNAHSVWRGRAMVVVQPTGEPGDVVLSAQADQLDGDALTITVE